MIYGQPITFGGASGEIDITDNGTFDVKKYATANVKVEPVLLWENPFLRETYMTMWNGYNFTVADVSKYPAVIFEVYPQNDASVDKNRCGYCLVKTDGTSAAFGASYSDTNEEYCIRVWFSNKTTLTKAGGATNICIPRRMWGVNFTL